MPKVFFEKLKKLFVDQNLKDDFKLDLVTVGSKKVYSKVARVIKI